MPSPLPRRVIRLLGPLLALLLLLGLGLGAAPGCSSGSSLRGELDRQSRGDQDLLALLPPDLDAAIDVDLAGLRKLEGADALLEIFKPGPEAGTLPLLQTLTDEPLRELEALCVGLSAVDLDRPEVIAVARGPLVAERIRLGVRRFGAAREVEYHGVPVIETDEHAAALLSPRAAAVGSRLSVRRVIDIFRNVDVGARQQEALVAALARAPRAKTGRPAILFASLLPPAMRKRAGTAGLGELLTGASFLSGAVAVGDGMDLIAVLGYEKLAEAQTAAAWLREQATVLARRPALLFLGAQRLVEPLEVVAAKAGGPRKVPEVHIGYRLPGTELQALLRRMETLRALIDKVQQPAE